MPRTNLELLTHGRTPSTVEKTEERNLVGPIVLSAVALGLAVAWSWFGATTYDRGLSSLDERALDRATAQWKLSAEDAQQMAFAEAKVLVDDVRIREPLATPGIDDMTLSDLLEELTKVTGASLLAITSPSGVVRVVSGADSLKALDLSGSTMMKTGGAPTAVWLLPDRVIAVAVAPIRLGANLSGYLLVGREFGKRALQVINETTAVSAGVVVQAEVVNMTNLDVDQKAVLIESGSIEGDHSVLLGGGKLLTRVVRIDSTRGGRLVLMINRRHAEPVLGIDAAIWWAPAVFVFLGSILWFAADYWKGRSRGGAT